MASPRNFVVCLKSIARVSGTSNNYVVQVPALPKGYYRATITINADLSTSTELAIQWPGTQNYFESGNHDPFKSICVFDVYPAQGVLYIQDPGSEVQIQFRQPGSGAAATIGESDLFIHFELMP